MAGNGNGGKRNSKFSWGRMSIAQEVIIGTYLIAIILIMKTKQDVDPATVFVAVVGLATGVIGFYFGTQMHGRQQQPKEPVPPVPPTDIVETEVLR